MVTHDPIDWLRVAGLAIGIIILLIGAALTLYLAAGWIIGLKSGGVLGTGLVAVTSFFFIPSLAVAWCGWLITRRCWDKNEIRPKFRRARK